MTNCNATVCHTDVLKSAPNYWHSNFDFESKSKLLCDLNAAHNADGFEELRF